jgi:hypothetical protein
MYGKTSVVGVIVGAGRLSSTGFGTAGYIFAASFLLVGGALLMRWGRRRVAKR